MQCSGMFCLLTQVLIYIDLNINTYILMYPKARTKSAWSIQARDVSGGMMPLDKRWKAISD